MAQTIKIKRSTGSSAPSSLANGELAYLNNSSNKKLYIGRPGGGTGDIDVIGGKDFTDKLELIGAANGSSTADASVVASANNLGVIRIGTGLSIAANGVVSADEVTTASVTAAGALMDSELTALASVKALNQGVATGDSPTFAALTSTGEITANGGIALGDNDKATFGASDDLQIYHDGSASYISEVGTGNLKIMGSNLEMKSTSDEMYLDATQDGVLRLYCNNEARLTTTGTGVTVSGDLKINNTTLENSLETGHIYGPEVLVIDPASHSANTGKVVIDGDLEVKGVTTTIDSTTVTIADNYIQLNSAQDPTTAPPTSMFCGIQVDRGSEAHDSGIYWIESTDEWVVNTGSAGIKRLIDDSNFEAKYPILEGGTF
tara:strand:+ start:2675 stop:3802 length:1128 start_codon:yes stop_codon:yes gene_type:complete